MDLTRTYRIKIVFPLMVLLIFVFLLNFKKVYAPGVFYHLKMGNVVAETLSPVKSEHFSFVKKGVKITHFEWLGDFIFYVIYNLFGFTGLGVFKTLICVLMFFILFIAVSKITPHKISLLFLIILIAYAISPFLTETPAIFTIFFFSIIVAILINPQSRWIYLLPSLFLIWANIHPGFVFGLFYYLSFIISICYEVFINKRKQYLRQLIILSSIFFISSGFTMLNPFGPDLYNRIIKLKVISDFIVKDEATIIKIFMSPFTFLFFISLCILSLYYIRSIDKRYFIPFIFLSWMPYYFANTVNILLLTCIPPGVLVINSIYSNNRVILEKISSLKTLRLFLKSFPFIIMLLFLLYQYFTDFPGVYGYGRLNKFYPDDAVKFIKEHKLYGKWFNSIEFGGAIILDGSPEILPFIYSDSNFLSDIFNNYYKKFVKEPQALNDFLRNSDIIGAIFMSGGDTLFAPHFDLLRKGAFALVYWDDNSVVLVNRNLVSQSFLNQYELQFINPFSVFVYLNSLFTSNGKIDPGLFNDIRISAERANNSGLAHLLFGMGLLSNGNYADAERELKKSFEIQPKSIFTNMGLALLSQKLERTDNYYYYQKRVERLGKIYKKLR